jgi:hypothetical protein
MIALVLGGWRPGLQKVALTKLLHARTGIPLSAAKRCVDDLLAGDEVRVPLFDPSSAKDIARAAASLGAIARIEEEAAPAPTSPTRS